MSFGIQNLGVINQKDAPAIWESDFLDFPVNFVFGRILVDNTNGGVYIDLLSSRKQILANNLGNITGENGVYVNETTGETFFGLGGTLNQNTTINLSGFDLTFDGSSISNKIDNLGVLKNVNNNIDYMPIEQDGNSVVPNTSLNIYNTRTGEVFRVDAEKL